MDARKAKSRAAIVTAFSELLCEKDYGKITVGDIIARAHVGRATFYGLFKSKDDLLAELVRDICTHALWQNPRKRTQIFFLFRAVRLQGQL